MLDNAFKEYLFFLKITKNLSPNTIMAYKRDLDDYINFLKKNYEIKDPNKITVVHVRNYLNKLKKASLEQKTVSRKISSIKSFHKFLITEKIVDENPLLFIEPPKRKKKLPNVLSINEVDNLIKLSIGEKPTDKRNEAMIKLIYGSGLRVSEILDLNLTDVHLNVNLIKVNGKGAKERIVPMNDETIRALRRYIIEARPLLKLKDKEAVFINKNGERLSRIGFFKIIKELALKAGIDKEISPHTLRHSFATHLIENGADIMAVKEMLGHEDIQTTENYTHISKDVLFKKYDEIYPRRKVK